MIRRGTVGLAGRKVGAFLLFGALPVILLALVLALSVGDDPAFDFRQFWNGGRDVLHGHSPYPPVDSLPTAEQAERLSPHAIQDTFRFPYPPATALAMAPLGAFPFAVAAAIVTALLIAAFAAALWSLGVMDWRAYGVVFGAIPTISAIRLGTLTPLLVLGLALVWRYRARSVTAGLLVAAVVLLKGFLWPVGVWLLLTRRYLAAGVAVATAALVTAVGFAVVGFDSIDRYREALSRLVDAVDGHGYSLVAMAGTAGAPEPAGRYLAVAVGVALLGAATYAVRARSDERSALVLAIAASLALSPIVWLHYFALLFVPIAIARRRLSALWLVPLVLWVTPYQETEGDLWRVVVAWLVVAVVVAGATAGGELVPFSRSSRRRQPA